MARFEIGIPKLLEREGGYVNNPNDPGKETKYGITKRRYPDEDIRNLTPERAAFLYRRDFWDAQHLGEIVDDGIAWKIMDMDVNMGEGTGTSRTQRALNYILRGTPVTVDGKMGPTTLGFINGLSARQTRILLLALEAYSAHRYIELVEGPDPRYDEFGEGWLVRAMGPAL